MSRAPSGSTAALEVLAEGAERLTADVMFDPFSVVFRDGGRHGNGHEEPDDDIVAFS
jgi:hypothetical protein